MNKVKPTLRITLETSGLKPSVLSTKHRKLPIEHRVLPTNPGVLSTKRGVLSSKPRVLSTKRSALSSKPRVLFTKHSVLSTKRSVLYNNLPLGRLNQCCQAICFVTVSRLLCHSFLCSPSDFNRSVFQWERKL